MQTINEQATGFKRLGIWGESEDEADNNKSDKPYKRYETLQPKYEAAQIPVFTKMGMRRR